MPFASQSDLDLPISPITMLPRGGDESWSMSYHAERRPNEMLGGFDGLGSEELDELNRLPRKLVEYLADEARDPAFVQDYLIDALRSPNPHERIIQDISREAYEYEEDRKHGVGGLGKKKKSFFKKIAKVVRTVHKKITPKFMQKIEGKIHKIERKVWKKYGSIIISVAGAILAPFTGGASMVAAALIVAGKTMYEKKKAAAEAKKMAKADAGMLAAEAAAQEAKTAADVDKFYAENQAWFLQYDITPDKWAKLTLDEKIKLINAGVEGKLPVGTTNVTVTESQAAAQTQQTAQAAAQAGIPQSAVTPPGASPGQGYGTSAGGAPPPEVVAAQAGGTFVAVVEGQSIGTFGSADEAFDAILGVTKPGDRFEIIANGQTLGLAVRTEDGAVEVPPEAEAKMRSLSRGQAHAIVQEAEKEQAKGGGFPWWILLVGGAAVAAAS